MQPGNTQQFFPVHSGNILILACVVPKDFLFALTEAITKATILQSITVFHWYRDYFGHDPKYSLDAGEFYRQSYCYNWLLFWMLYLSKEPFNHWLVYLVSSQLCSQPHPLFFLTLQQLQIQPPRGLVHLHWRLAVVHSPPRWHHRPRVLHKPVKNSRTTATMASSVSGSVGLNFRLFECEFLPDFYHKFAPNTPGWNQQIRAWKEFVPHKIGH